MTERLPLPEPPNGCWWDQEAIDAMHAHAAAQSAADNAALLKQIAAYKVVLAGMDQRNIAQGKEYGLLMQRAADTDGERAANAILTSEVEALTARVKVLEDALESISNIAARRDVYEIARAALEKT